MFRLTQELPAASDVLSLSKEELAGYILADLNSAAASRAADAPEYRVVQRDYIRGAEEAYRSADAADNLAISWRWAIDQGYLTEYAGEAGGGWYRLTARGREVRKPDQIVIPRVPRDINPGPPPNFHAVTNDGDLRKQLWVLWEEAVICYRCGANLSTIVMLGSLLEGALLGKALGNPADANRAAASPKEPDGVVKPFRKWSLANFIEVANECGWIHKTRGNFSDTLRDYRNLVHPFKAKDVNYRVDHGTAAICWQVAISTLADLGIQVGGAD